MYTHEDSLSTVMVYYHLFSEVRFRVHQFRSSLLYQQLASPSITFPPPPFFIFIYFSSFGLVRLGSDFTNSVRFTPSINLSTLTIISLVMLELAY